MNEWLVCSALVLSAIIQAWERYVWRQHTKAIERHHIVDLALREKAAHESGRTMALAEMLASIQKIEAAAEVKAAPKHSKEGETVNWVSVVITGFDQSQAEQLLGDRATDEGDDFFAHIKRLSSAAYDGDLELANKCSWDLVFRILRYGNEQRSRGQLQPTCELCGADAVTICTKNCDNDE